MPDEVIENVDSAPDAGAAPSAEPVQIDESNFRNAEPTGSDYARDYLAQQAKEDTAKPEPVAPAAPAAPAEPVEQPNANQPNYEQVIQQYAAYVQQLEQQIERAKQPVAQSQKPAQGEFDVNEWRKLVDTDPVKAIQMAALQSPAIKQFEARMKQYEAQESRRAEEAYLNRLDALQAQTAQKYPQLKAGTEEYRATYHWITQNSAWLRNVSQQDPNFNPIEHAYKSAVFDLMLQKNTAQAAKLVDKRGKSVTVRPGVTTPVTPATGSTARDAAAEEASRGNVVPDTVVASMERALRKHDFK